ncbi:MAG: OmpH family outer membrane protein [bacterium]|nr:MAG: outer membrane protein [bacterium F082]KWW30101.1 MAG: outer membrane protein [bacterium P201]MBR6227995.1 OmpH family outer membrane protein [Bacteroidales bacterium]MDO5316190.1 OmpH family outer membrane protein [bacterium]
MNKLFKVMFLGVALFVMSGIANAQVKIAHVNTAEILDAMPDKAKAEKSLEKYYGELQSQLETMAKEYQTKMQDYEANQATMSNLVKQSKEKEIVDLQTRITQFQANAENEFENKRAELLKPILDKIQNAINAVGKEKGYTYMLDLATGAAVYVGDNAVDATKDVKSKLGIK